MGEQFIRTELVSAMSLIISALAIIRSYELLTVEANNILDIIFAGVIVIVFTLIVIGISHALGFMLISLSQQIPAKIIIEAPDDIKPEKGKSGYKETMGFIAYLNIFNKEYDELTNCFAVVKKAKIKFPGMNDTVGVEGKRLNWENRQTENCEISIPRRTGKEMLRVLIFSIILDKAQRPSTISCFDICDKNQLQNIDLYPVTKFEIEIEFYGKLRGEDVKIKPFKGYIDVIPYEIGRSVFPMKIYKKSLWRDVIKAYFNGNQKQN